MQYRLCAHVPGLNRVTYVSEEEEPQAAAPPLDCALGVNPFGCSPAMREALATVTSEDAGRYPAFPYLELRRSIADYWQGTADVSAVCIRMGNGAIGTLDMINKLFIDRSALALGYSPQFTDYVNDVYGYGGGYEFYRLTPEDNYRFDCDAFLRCLRPGHTVVYLDNPNNPTGQVISLDAIREIAARAGKLGACLIVDEAYGDYLPLSASAACLLHEFSNLFIVKSFSKGFGLAGLRAGYLVACKRLIEYYQQVELPFSINAFAEKAVGAALTDRAFLEASARGVAEVKSEALLACRKLLPAATSPRTPLLVLRSPDESVDLHAAFLRNGVLTEAGDGFPGLGHNAVRVRVPTQAHRLVAAIRAVEAEL